MRTGNETFFYWSIIEKESDEANIKSFHFFVQMYIAVSFFVYDDLSARVEVGHSERRL